MIRFFFSLVSLFFRNRADEFTNVGMRAHFFVITLQRFQVIAARVVISFFFLSFRNKLTVNFRRFRERRPFFFFLFFLSHLLFLFSLVVVYLRRRVLFLFLRRKSLSIYHRHDFFVRLSKRVLRERMMIITLLLHLLFRGCRQIFFLLLHFLLFLRLFRLRFLLSLFRRRMLVLLSLFHQQLLGIRDIVPASFPFRSLLLTRRGGVESNRRRRGPAPRASRRRPSGRRRRRHHRHALHPLPLFPRATSAKIRAKQRKYDNQQHALSNAFVLKETFPPASREIGGGSEPGRRSPRGDVRVRPKIPRRRFRLPRFPIVKICFRFILVRPRRGPGADFTLLLLLLLLLFHRRRGRRRGRL